MTISIQRQSGTTSSNPPSSSNESGANSPSLGLDLARLETSAIGVAMLRLGLGHRDLGRFCSRRRRHEAWTQPRRTHPSSATLTGWEVLPGGENAQPEL